MNTKNGKSFSNYHQNETKIFAIAVTIDFMFAMERMKNSNGNNFEKNSQCYGIYEYFPTYFVILFFLLR